MPTEPSEAAASPPSPEADPSDLPLAGVTVVELGDSASAPFGGQVFALLGAEVWKIERPGSGDSSRGWGPSKWKGSGAAWHALNRGKRSIVVDLDKPGGPEVVKRLAATADIFITTTGNVDIITVEHMAKMDQYLDLIIPRGGKGLIEKVVATARMPVIKHYDGVCHVYVHADADPQMAADIIVNSKCQKPGVCNALETILVHQDIEIGRASCRERVSSPV